MMAQITIPADQSIERAIALVKQSQRSPSDARIADANAQVIEVAWLRPAVEILFRSGFYAITSVEVRPA